jgi:chaperonin GroEL
MAKEIKYDSKAKKGLKKGVDKIANAVKVTLGPQGRNVMIDAPFGMPLVINDGVTVAKSIELEDRLENMGAALVKGVASKTDTLVGDGTTTATVLAQVIVREGLKALSAEINPIEVKRGMDKAVKAIVYNLNQIKKEITEDGIEIKDIAMISANNDDEIGYMIALAYAKIGKDGVISIEESTTTSTYVDLAEGMEFDNGYFSPYFVNTPDGEVHLKDVRVLLSEEKIEKMEQIMSTLEASIGQGKALLIIAKDFDPEVTRTLIINKMEAGAAIALVKSPGFGERKRDLLEDISISLGGSVRNKDLNKFLSKTTLKDLGQCESVKIDYHKTTLIGGNSKKEMVDFRIKEIEAQKVNAENDYEKEQFDKRIAKLKNGVGVIYVGAPSEVEAKEKKERIKDALNSTKAALQEGIVCGGGVALIQASCKVNLDLNPAQMVGVKIILKACKEPLKQIAENAGANGEVVLAKVLEGTMNSGFDAKENIYVNDMFEAGIIDPVKVTISALESANSIAGMILTTECVLVDIVETNPKQATPRLPKF